MARTNKKGGGHWRKGFSGFKSTSHRFDERDLKNLTNIRYTNPEDIEQFEHFKSILPSYSGGADTRYSQGEEFDIGDNSVSIKGSDSYSDTKLSPDFVKSQIALAKKIRDKQDMEMETFGPGGPKDKITIKPIKTKLPTKTPELPKQPTQNAKVTTDKKTKKTVVTETDKKKVDSKNLKVNKKTNLKIINNKQEQPKKKTKNRGNRKSWAAAEKYIPQSQRG